MGNDFYRMNELFEDHGNFRIRIIVVHVLEH